MNEVSVTITAGLGSEKHNHDLKYREGLDHTDTANCPEAIIEMVEYKSYKEKINDLMKPFIDEYNADVEARYQAAWARYESGERKSKPKKKDFQKMDYDYFGAHKDDTIINPHTKKVEKIPIFRSWIIGIGDMHDRQEERITEDQARKIFAGFMDEFKEKFPHFKILGATIHLDEKGFYHFHLDYKPVMEMQFSKGLQVTTSQDTILESMGYQPEQSVINGRDKVPILFNSLRNQMYYMMEKEMADNGLRLQYGVTKTKQPGKNSGVNESLDNWQAEQDAIRSMQHQKNIILDSISSEAVSPEGLSAAVFAAEQIEGTMKQIQESPRTRLDKNKGVVEFRLIDQLGSFVRTLMGAFHHVFSQLQRAVKRYHEAAARADAAEKEVRRLAPYEEKYNALTAEQSFDDMLQNASAGAKLQMAEKEISSMRAFMRKFRVNNRPLDEVYQDEKAHSEKMYE